MKREHVLIVVLALFAVWIASAGAVSPQYGTVPAPTVSQFGWDAASSTFRAVAVDNDGNVQMDLVGGASTGVPVTNVGTNSVNVVVKNAAGTEYTTSAPFPTVNYVAQSGSNVAEQAKFSRVQSTVNAKIDSVATNAATIISTVASITPPCSVVISCPVGELWIAEGVATTTAASVKYHIIEEKQSRVYNISTSTYDFSVMSADTAVSSCSISVHSLVQ